MLLLMQDYSRARRITLWAFGTSMAGGDLVALNKNPFSPDVQVIALSWPYCVGNWLRPVQNYVSGMLHPCTRQSGRLAPIQTPRSLPLGTPRRLPSVDASPSQPAHMPHKL